jgi:hypothetical protein
MAQDGPKAHTPDEQVVPLLAAGPRIVAREIRRTVVDCPRCGRTLNITDVAVGMRIECPAPCGNVTWRPTTEERWWFPVGRFVGATVLSFMLGVLSSLLATWWWVRLHPPTQPVSEQTTKRN